MSGPAVSVLMTVFNTGAYVREAIDCVLAQTLADLELIAVDDASTDDSWTIVAEAARRDPRVTAIRRDVRGGASAGLNMALAVARGRYVTRQDSDDGAVPSRLAEQVAFLERHSDTGAVGTDAVTIDSQGNPLDVMRGPEADAEIQAALVDGMCFCGPTVMIRKSVLDRLAFRFDEALSGSEDYDLCLRVSEVAKLANLRRPLYLYRQHGSSVSREQRYRQLLRKAAALENAIRRRGGPVPPPSLLRNVARDYLRAAVVGHATNEGDVRDCVARILALDPTVLENGPLVRYVVEKYTPASSLEAALTFTESLFATVLPSTRRLRRVRRQLVAALHVKHAFAGLQTTPQATDSTQHLWSAVTSDPAWLTNRGVLALLLRHAIGRSGPRHVDERSA